MGPLEWSEIRAKVGGFTFLGRVPVLGFGLANFMGLVQEVRGLG